LCLDDLHLRQIERRVLQRTEVVGLLAVSKESV